MKVIKDMDDIFVFSEDTKTIIGLKRSDMSTLSIPEGVVKIDYNVLADCKNLLTIVLPNSLESYGSFDGCDNLRSISVGSDNIKYLTKDGVLYNKDKTKLIRVPQNIQVDVFEIPNGVTTIWGSAFCGCKSLSCIVISPSVIRIGWHAFEGCNSLQSITIPDSVRVFEFGIFHSCKSLRAVTLPNDIKRIEESMFYDCSSLTEFTIPDTVEEIGKYAFWGTSIRRIKIPKGVSLIDEDCFSLCKYLEAVDVDKDNLFYSSEKGILMNKERNRILCYPCNKDISHLVIPDGVLKIELPSSRFYTKLGKLRILEIPQSIESIPDNYFKNCVNLQSIIISEGVTHIGEHSFANCRKLREIIIPGSVKTIGKGAFENCQSLSKVTINQGVASVGEEVFKNCKSLKNVIIADSVSEIGEESFAFCDSLSEVVLPKGIKKIEVRLFYSCESLRGITLPQGVTEIGVQAFCGCKQLCDIVLPNTITKIDSYSLGNCSSLHSINIPKGVTEIEQWTFMGCSSLKSITIPNGITKIDDSFSDCSSLTHIYIPDSVVEINHLSFDGCISLQSINVSSNNLCYSSEDGILYSKDKTKLIKVPEGLISEDIIVPYGVTEIDSFSFSNMERVFHIELPDSLTSIGNCAFSGCKSLKKIHLPKNLSNMGKGFGKHIFDDCSSLDEIIVEESNEYYTSIKGVLYDKEVSKLIKMPQNCGVEHFVVPTTIVEIVGNAFKGCNSLKSIDMTDSVIRIGASAFEGCISLQTIEIPNSVIELGSSAFKGCSALQEIEIPNSMTSIKSSTFKNCSSLYSIDIPNSVSGIESSAFEGCSSLQSIDVPNSISSIKWNAFRGCASLKTFKIPSDLITLAMNVFNGCTSLRQINIPQSITKIEDFAFHNAGLEEVRLSSNVEEIGKHAFCNNPIKLYTVEKGNKSFFANDGVLYQRVSARWVNGDEIESYNLVKYPEQKQDKSYVVDDRTIWIGSCAFKNAECLEEISLSDEINSIGEQAFAACKSLKKLVYPKGVSYVPRKAFDYCMSLEEVYLTSVKEIYSEAFSDCTMLKSIHLYCDDAYLINVSFDAFNNVDTETCILYVPSGSRWSYRHHPIFGKFKNIVIEKQ